MSFLPNLVKPFNNLQLQLCPQPYINFPPMPLLPSNSNGHLFPTPRTDPNKTMAVNLAYSILFLCLILSVICLCRSEFTVVLPDSSALVDAPQTGFSDRARTDPDEQRAVLAVMAATGNGWAASIPDVCRGRWHGIECVPDRDDVYHVVSLSFGALSDDTAFPACDTSHAALSPAVLALPHLRSLFFYRCFSSNPQPIPAFLGHLGPAFRSLVLRQNGHVGPIPAELGNLTGLRMLDLHGNHLTFSIPSSLQTLTRLQLLDLSYNKLGGKIPEFKFPALSILDLSHNALQGQIPSSLGKCGSLLKMDLSRNDLAGPIPDAIGDLTALTLLDLSRNALSGPLPRALGRLSSIRALILSNNPMQTSANPDDLFAGLKELTTLVLSGMGLQGPMPVSVGELPSVRVLHLDNNDFTGPIPANFRLLEKASEIRIDGNRLEGPIPFGKEMMWRMGEKLRVGSNAGLCFDAREEGLEGIAALAGVGDCESVRSHTTQHLYWSSTTTSSSHEVIANLSSSVANGVKDRHGRFLVFGCGIFMCLLALL